MTKGRAYQLSWVCIHKSSLFTTCRTFQSNLLTKYNGCTSSNLACSQTVQHCPISLLTSYSWYTSTNLVCSQTAHQQTACLPIFNNVPPQISMFTNCTTLKKLLWCTSTNQTYSQTAQYQQAVCLAKLHYMKDSLLTDLSTE